jgi:uncharacterized iron-regulated membrane protein
MYGLLVALHRYVGLTIALFLVVASLTGSIIAFHKELDAWANPDLFYVPERLDLPTTELVRRVEATDPRIHVAFVEVSVEPGRSAAIFVEPKADVTGLEYNQVLVDPSSGQILGRRDHGGCCLQPRAAIPFLYNLHRRLSMPGHWGDWLMGGVAILWFFDCFVALALGSPRHIFSARRWRTALGVRWRSSGYRITFDLHRAAGLWTWLVLGVLAFTSIYLNLGEEIVRPATGAISTLSPTPYDQARAPADPSLGQRSFDEIVQLSAKTSELVDRGFAPTGIYYDREAKIYLVDFENKSPFMFGFAWAAFDASTGRLLGTQLPGVGSSGDVFLQLQFPLHSGRIGGLAGRIFISIMGVAIAMPSITGILIWSKKRRARIKRGLRMGSL